MNKKIKSYYFIIVIIIATCMPRFCVIGFFPCIDEALYAYFSKNIFIHLANGNGLPDFGRLFLHQVITSWIYGLSGINTIYLRIFDLICACVASYYFIKIIHHESRNDLLTIIISCIFMCQLNYFDVIDAGYKNSIIVATIPFLISLNIALSIKESKSLQWYVVGMLVALGVLFRENFYFFAILGFISIWLGWGKSAALRYAIGGILAGAFIFASMICMRGGVSELISYYANEQKYYFDESHRILKNLIIYSWQSTILFLGSIILTFWFCLLMHNQRILFTRNKKRWIFWFFVMVLPLQEPILKYGFTYHFANCLYGLAGICSLASSEIQWSNLSERTLKLTKVVIVICCILSIYNMAGNFKKFGITYHNINYFLSFNKWDENCSIKSKALEVVNRIRRECQEPSSMMVSGDSYFLYDMLNAYPPNFGNFKKGDLFQVGDLSRAFLFMDRKIETMTDCLEKNSPEFIVLAFTGESHVNTYHVELREAILRTKKYLHVDSLPPASGKHLGWLGFDVYKLVN